MASVKRLGLAPKDRKAKNRSQEGQCPDVLCIEHVEDLNLNLQGTEGMRSGTVYAVVGTLLDEAQVKRIVTTSDAPEVEVANYEAVVAIPEEVLQAAARGMQSQSTHERVLVA